MIPHLACTPNSASNSFESVRITELQKAMDFIDMTVNDYDLFMEMTPNRANDHNNEDPERITLQNSSRNMTPAMALISDDYKGINPDTVTLGIIHVIEISLLTQ